MERHQEVETIGSTETGAEVTLSHALPRFHPKESGNKTKQENVGEYSSEELMEEDQQGSALMIHGQTPLLIAKLRVWWTEHKQTL